MSDKIQAYLKQHRCNRPRLIVDLDLVRQRYQSFLQALPLAKVYYAVKANPEQQILHILAQEGSCFDAASPPEIDAVLAAGADAARISYGNTIKKEADIAYAYAKGVRLFAFDCVAELHKIARHAPNAQVFCRILCDGAGAEWPLSRKFGCDTDMAIDLLQQAKQLGLTPRGVSFHVGSQQNNVHAWEGALEQAAYIFRQLHAQGIVLDLLNLGGGFPARYTRSVPDLQHYGAAIMQSVQKYFGDVMPHMIIEPGRGMVGDAGILEAEVVLVSHKSSTDSLRWVYLDIGKFGGLAETADESIRYPIITAHDAFAERVSCVVAGPTCDSVDVLYEKKPYMLPPQLTTGDKVQILGAGAYTVTYAAFGFNGFAPPQVVCL